MSTSSVMTKSGAVALDSAIRRATVRCSRFSSSWVTSPRPASPSRAGFFGASAGFAGGAPARRGCFDPGGGLDVGLDDPPARAAALDAGQIELVLPRHAAGDRATPSTSARLAARAPPVRRVRLLAFRLGSACRLGVLGRLAPGHRRFADPRDRRADGERVALLGHDLQRARRVGLVGHVGLVRLDLDELFALGDLVAVGLEPLQDRALLHGVGQAGHGDVGHAPQATGSVKRKTAPPPSRSSIQIRPPWRSTILRQIARPIPVPS